MNLHDQFEAVAREGSDGSGERLRSSDARARISSRVRRGRAVRDAGIGVGSLAAVAIVAAAAVAGPRALGWFEPAATSDAPRPEPSPSLTPSPTPTAFVIEDIIGPAPEPFDGLAAGGNVWTYWVEPSCEAFTANPRVITGELPSAMPIPSTIETGRLYGWGDDVLVGGYPQPVPTELRGLDWTKAKAARYVGSPALHLTGADGSVWVFSLTWEERDDLPHDAPGFFVSLSPNYECSSDGVIPAGVYQSRLGYSLIDGTDYIAQLSDITVVAGVPSLPEIHAQG